MVIGEIGKILLTDIAKTSKFCEKPFCLARQTLPKLEGLKLAPLTSDVGEFSRIKYSADEIRKAYQEYAKSPYVNAYMRRGLPLSENSEK